MHAVIRVLSALRENGALEPLTPRFTRLEWGVNRIGARGKALRAERPCAGETTG